MEELRTEAHDGEIRAALQKHHEADLLDHYFGSFSSAASGDETIVIVCFTNGYTEENVDAFLRDFENILNEPREFILVLDVHLLGIPPNLWYIIHMVEFLHCHRDLLKQQVTWSMLLLPDETPLLHSVLDIIFSIVPPQKPFFKLMYGDFLQWDDSGTTMCTAE